MQGRYCDGHAVDRSVERMPFPRIAEHLATELGRQQYFPAPAVDQADLLIVVHWGTTLPVISIKEMTARTRRPATTRPASHFEQAGPHRVQSRGRGQLGVIAEDKGLGRGPVHGTMMDLADNDQTQLQLDRQEQIADQAGSEVTRSDNITGQ